MTTEKVSQIRSTIAALRSPDDVAEIAKMAQSDAIAAALADDGTSMERCLAIAEAAEETLDIGFCQLQAPRYRARPV